MKIKYVCFNITSQCNMTCPYCFRVGNTYGNVTLEKAKQYINIIKKYGCEMINITGGEPLLNSQWRNIIEYCSDIGMYIILSTNGLNLDINDSILEKINVLSLPLDGGNELVNSKTRNQGHFDQILKLLEDYNNKNYNFKIKINTVVSEYNLDNLNDILNIVNYKHLVWKLFELREKGEFYNFPKEKISNINRVEEKISELLLKSHNCDICFLGKSLKNGIKLINPNYIILDYNGDLYFADEDNNKRLFNIEDKDSEDKLYNMEIDLLSNQYYEDEKR